MRVKRSLSYKISQISARFPLDNLDIAKSYLFGSSTIEFGCDWDILFISADFEGVSNAKRKEKVKLSFQDLDIDPVCISDAEFSRLLYQNSTFLSMILPDAILVYERSDR